MSITPPVRSLRLRSSRAFSAAAFAARCVLRLVGGGLLGSGLLRRGVGELRLLLSLRLRLRLALLGDVLRGERFLRGALCRARGFGLVLRALLRRDGRAFRLLRLRLRRERRAEVRLRLLLRAVHEAGEHGERRECDRHCGAADPGRARRDGDRRVEERALALGQLALIAPAPQPRLVERLASPQEARGPALGVPLLRGAADLREVRRVLLVLVEPAAQRRPARDQRLVDELDRAFAARSARRAAAPRPARATMRWTSGEMSRSSADVDDRARALGRDQPLEDRAHELAVAGRELREHLVGVGRERARDAAHRGVALARQHAPLAVALLPQLRRA